MTIFAETQRYIFFLVEKVIFIMNSAVVYEACLFKGSHIA